MRPTISLAIIALIGGLLTIGAVDDKPAEAIAAPIAQPNPLAADVAALSVRQHEHGKLIESLLLRAACDCNDDKSVFDDSPEPEQQQLAVLTSAAVCTSESCGGMVSSGGSRGIWYPGKRVVTAVRSSRSSGNGWYPGKTLGRLFGRRR